MDVSKGPHWEERFRLGKLINIFVFFSFFFTGGLSAVIYTDVMQCILMIIGALSLSILGK